MEQASPLYMQQMQQGGMSPKGCPQREVAKGTSGSASEAYRESAEETQPPDFAIHGKSVRARLGAVGNASPSPLQAHTACHLRCQGCQSEDVQA